VEVIVDVRLNGVEEKLNSLGPKLAKKAMRKGLKGVGAVWVQEVQIQSPVDTGRLRDHISVEIHTSGSEEQGSVEVGPADGKDGFYGRFQEFGTKNQPPNAFLRRAFDATADAVVEVFLETLNESIEEMF